MCSYTCTSIYDAITSATTIYSYIYIYIYIYIYCSVAHRGLWTPLVRGV